LSISLEYNFIAFSKSSSDKSFDFPAAALGDNSIGLLSPVAPAALNLESKLTDFCLFIGGGKRRTSDLELNLEGQLKFFILSFLLYGEP
jgi:hypothetical protein